MKDSFKASKDALEGEKLSIAVVVSRFNDQITTRLLSGATEALKKHNVEEKNIRILSVPGAFELPLAALHVAETEKYDAIVCLAAVLRGETPHFDYICNEVSRGLMDIMLTTGVPCGFGVLTLENVEQGLARTEPGSANKGFEAAEAALEMALLAEKLRS